MSSSTSGSVLQSSAAPFSQSCTQPQNVQCTRQKTDPAWNHVKMTIEEGGKKVYTCVYCAKVFRGGGIDRIKQHLAEKNCETLSCKKVDGDTKYRMEENLKEIAARKKKSVDTWDDEHPFGPNVMEFDGDDIHEIPPPQVAEARVNTTIPPALQRAKKRPIETTNNYFAPRTTPGAQPTTKSVFAGKEVVHKVDLVVATFFIENCIPMNALNSNSYLRMIDAIGSFVPGYKGPNYHAMRTNLLSDMKKNV